MSAPTDDAAPRLAQVAAARVMVFLAFWLMVSGWALADLPVGLAAVAAATWTSLRFLPPPESRLRLAPLAALAMSFFRQSVVSGTDVARRALSARMQLQPGFVPYPLRLPPGGERSAFCTLSESDAGNTADRHRRKRGASRSLSRRRTAGRCQSGGGRALVHPGVWP